MPCDSPITVIKKGDIKKGKLYKDDVRVPCGKCPPCKTRRVNEWVFRLKQEDKISSSSLFVTLTYDTEHIPITQNGFMTLDKKDPQKFLKRLRKKQNDKITYYMVGEYGTQNKRPHYHAIMFNINNIEHINTCWQLGAIHVGTVTSDSIAYTTKYIDKPKRIPEHQRDDRIKEYSVMSNGIGKNYITEATKRWHNASLDHNYVSPHNGIRVPMPKYYAEKLYDQKTKEKLINHIQIKMQEQETKKKLEYGDRWEQIKEQGALSRHNKFYKNQKIRK